MRLAQHLERNGVPTPEEEARRAVLAFSTLVAAAEAATIQPTYQNAPTEEEPEERRAA